MKSTPVKLAVECYVELAGIIVNSSLLGRSLTIKRDTWAYRIDLPTLPDSFKYMAASAQDHQDERDYEASMNYIGDPNRGFTEIRIVRVIVNATVADSGFERGTSDHDAWANETFLDLRSRALSAAVDLTDLIRLRGQRNIEPTGRYPRVLNLASLLELDGSTARSFGWSIGEVGTFRIFGDEEVLTEESFSEIEKDLAAGRVAGVGELLVGESLYLAQSHQRSGPAQATLLAAMGVEVHTKYALRRLVDEAGAQLLELLLENPRDWSTAAASLFSKVLPQVVGRDLGQQHASLSKRVQRLFEARNRVAHKGQDINPEEATLHTDTALVAAQFLRALI